MGARFKFERPRIQSKKFRAGARDNAGHIVSIASDKIKGEMKNLEVLYKRPSNFLRVSELILALARGQLRLCA